MDKARQNPVIIISTSCLASSNIYSEGLQSASTGLFKILANMPQEPEPQKKVEDEIRKEAEQKEKQKVPGKRWRNWIHRSWIGSPEAKEAEGAG